MPVTAYTDWPANTPMPPRETLPTMFDLPYEEIGEPAMPDEFHPLQAMLLSETFQPTTVAPDQFMTATDLYLYYNWKNTLWYKRPDWFAVVGVPRLHPQSEFRYSYVAYHEGVPPLIVVVSRPVWRDAVSGPTTKACRRSSSLNCFRKALKKKIWD